MTAAQRFEELRSLDDTIPDYIGWIEGNAQFEQSPQQQQTSTPPQNSPTLQQFIERTKQRNPDVDISEMTIGGLSVEEYWKQNYGGEN